MCQRIDIQEYLDQSGEAANALATRAGVNPATLWKFLKKKQKALSPDDAYRISKATGFKVSVLSILYPGREIEVVVRMK